LSTFIFSKPSKVDKRPKKTLAPDIEFFSKHWNEFRGQAVQTQIEREALHKYIYIHQENKAEEETKQPFYPPHFQFTRTGAASSLIGEILTTSCAPWSKLTRTQRRADCEFPPPTMHLDSFMLC